MSVTEDVIYNKLRTLKGDHESIVGSTTWVLNNVKCISSISRVWLDVFITASDDLKIALIYLLNDACQKAKKTVKELSHRVVNCFYYHLRYACIIASDDVKSKIRRVVGILYDRQVFSERKRAELIKLLDGELSCELPLEAPVAVDPEMSLADASKASADPAPTFRQTIERYLQEEAVLSGFNAEEGGSAKKPKLDSELTKAKIAKEESDFVSMVEDATMGSEFPSEQSCQELVTGFLDNMKRAKDGVEASHDLYGISQRVQQVGATSIAVMEGKEGYLSRKTLGLEHSLPAMGCMDDLPAVPGCEYTSWKAVRTERLKLLKKKVDETTSQDNAAEKYSPTKTSHELIRPDMVSMSSQSTEKEFLDSIPLPEGAPVASIPLPPE